MLDTSITLVIIAHIVVSLLLILLILMQRPKQEGLGAAFGSGMTDAAWGARTTDVLQKGTVYLGTLFFVFSLVLAILMGKRNAIEGKNFAVDGANSATPAVIEAADLSGVEAAVEVEVPEAAAPIAEVETPKVEAEVEPVVTEAEAEVVEEVVEAVEAVEAVEPTPAPIEAEVPAEELVAPEQ